MRLPHNWVRGRSQLNGVQTQGNPGVVLDADGLGNLINVEEHNNALGVRVELSTNLVGYCHDYQRWLLIRTHIIKFQPLLYFISSFQPKERARFPDKENILEIKMGSVDCRESWLQSRVDQEGIHCCPITLIVPCLWESDGKIVRLICPIE